MEKLTKEQRLKIYEYMLLMPETNYTKGLCCLIDTALDEVLDIQTRTNSHPLCPYSSLAMRKGVYPEIEEQGPKNLNSVYWFPDIEINKRIKIVKNAVEKLKNHE